MTHDVIVVGAGSAGCVVADRLSRSGRRILVVEAGPDSPRDSEERSIRSRSFFDALDLPGRTWPNLVARRTAAGRARPYARGRGVGGSSSVNAMVGLWGEVDDYDSWERDFGCVGWSWRDVEPYFRRVEIPLTRAETGSDSRMGAALVEAGRTAGWSPHRGPFPLAGSGSDVGPAMLTCDSQGRRVSASDVYLDRARSRGNVDVRTDCLVDRLLIEDGRCIGIGLADGTSVFAGTVVVCAGAVHTPAVLLRSGIEREAIGAGLQDHPSVSFTFELKDACPVEDPAVTSLARLSSGSVTADLQILALDHLGAADAGLGSLEVALMHVTSRGRVAVSSDDPHVDPDVAFELLSTEDDIARLAVGVRTILEFVVDGRFSRVADRILIDDVGSDVASLDTSPQGLADWMLMRAGAYVHAGGSCAMGDPASSRSVVDPFGRVIGVKGAYVCDASVFPRLPRANTHLPVMMVAEKLSDHIAASID